jgi:hypothetical protein
MQSAIESAIKLVLVVLLVLAGLGVWLLPKTRLVTARAVGERLFVVTCIVGVLCGAAGLLVLFAWPQRVLEWHLWEVAAMPLVLLYAYWMVVMRRARSCDVLDEKQNADMTSAGAVTWAISIPAMSLAFVLPDEGLLEGGLWFPCYLFITLLVFSATTLCYFRR